MRNWIYILILLVFCCNIQISYAADGEKKLGLSEAAIQIRDDVSIRNIRKDLARLSSLESRVTGYPQAANGSKYIFDRFVEMGLKNVESREFTVTVPIDYGNSAIEILSSDGNVLQTFSLKALWPNLVRTSLLADGVKHTVAAGETLEIIAENYAVSLTDITENPHNQYLPSPIVEGNTVFIPIGGLTGPLLDGDDAQLADFNGSNVGGFWYELQEGDTLVSLARRFRVTQASITDDVLNGHLQKASDGIDNDEDGIIDEYGEIPLLSEILGWGTDGIDNNANGWTDEIPGDATDGIDNNKDGQIDETGEFIAASESHIFIPKGAIVLTEFNSGTRWINAAMLGASAVIFIEPETTIRGEAENKFLTVPANIPRFWVSKTDATQLKEMLDTGEEVNVRLRGKMKWERRVGQNIRGFLEGGDPVLRDELVVLTAYYDAMSVVPAIAPGADPTCGIAVMMELVRLFGEPQYRPGRSVLFVAVDAHFQGLAGMRAFMEGIGQDIVGSGTDSPGTPTLQGLRRGLSTDIIEFEELGRKLLLSIDRTVLVDLDADFYHGVHGIKDDLDSLSTTLEGLASTRSQIDVLHRAQRDFSERQKKDAERNRKREKQGFTEEEKSRLDANLVRFEKEALQTTHFLRQIVSKLGQIRSSALVTSKKAQQELIEDIALPIARLDTWAVDRLIRELDTKEISDKYGTHPNYSYLLPIKNGSDYQVPTPDDLPSELNVDIEKLNMTLANWEMSDSRKFALMWTPDKILDRHLDLPTLRKARDARKTLASTTETEEVIISRERALLQKVQENIKDNTLTENQIKEAITQLRTDRLHDLPSEIQTQYLTVSTQERIDRINAQLRQRLTETEAADVISESEGGLLKDLTRDKQGIFEIALRNARLEQERIQNLLETHNTLTREYLDEELLILQSYLSIQELEQAKDARKRIAAYLTEAQILQAVKLNAAADVIALGNLVEKLPTLTSDLDTQTKVLLRDNMLTLRNARFRNIQSRVEKMSRISEDEYNRKLAQIEAAVALQDLFNRYYTSLFCSIDLSSQSNQFGVFNKGWFYDQEPEFVLRREFASIGNKLADYAADADFGVRVRKLWRATDDQIRQAVMARQWSVASQISDKAALEGKTLETLLSAHYGKLTGLGGVSRLMKMQFEQWRNRGEPSEDMLKDMDYIRKEVERFIRNDVRSAKKSRKNSIRMREQLDAMLRLRHENPDTFTEDEIEDIKTLISIVGLGGAPILSMLFLPVVERLGKPIYQEKLLLTVKSLHLSVKRELHLLLLKMPVS